MSNFFQPKVVKCSKCNIQKKHDKKEIEISSKSIGYLKGNKNSEILIILPELLSDLQVSYLEDTLFKLGIQEYAIICSLECSVKKTFIKYKTPEIIFECNPLKLNLFPKIKVILTVGSALYSVTKNKDISTWEDFIEILYNQTYFYMGFNSKKKIRVYPLPSIEEIKSNNFDNFENLFMKKQLSFAKDFVNGK